MKNRKKCRNNLIFKNKKYIIYTQRKNIKNVTKIIASKNCCHKQYLDSVLAKKNPAVKDEKTMSEKVLQRNSIRYRNRFKAHHARTRVRNRSAITHDFVKFLVDGVKAPNNKPNESLSLFEGLSHRSVEDLIVRFELDKFFPVDLKPILKCYDIVLQPTDFKSLESHPSVLNNVCTKGSVLGAVKVINNQICIFYKKGDLAQRQRFVIAYELAQCCLHANEIASFGHKCYRLELESPLNKNDDAYLFACELMIPQSIIDKIYAAVKCPDINAFVKEFDVPKDVAINRLKRLNKEYTDSVKNG